MSGGTDDAAQVPPAGADAVGSASVSPTAGAAADADAAFARSPSGIVDGATHHGARRWLAASVVAFGLLYAYDLFEAISNLLGVAQLNGIADEAGVPPVVPWVLPITAVALPPVAYAVALVLGRRRNAGERALLLLAGLAAVAAITLSLTALA